MLQGVEAGSRRRPAVVPSASRTWRSSTTDGSNRREWRLTAGAIPATGAGASIRARARVRASSPSAARAPECFQFVQPHLPAPAAGPARRSPRSPRGRRDPWRPRSRAAARRSRSRAAMPRADDGVERSWVPVLRPDQGGPRAQATAGPAGARPGPGCARAGRTRSRRSGCRGCPGAGRAGSSGRAARCRARPLRAAGRRGRGPSRRRAPGRRPRRSAPGPPAPAHPAGRARSSGTARLRRSLPADRTGRRRRCQVLARTGSAR